MFLGNNNALESLSLPSLESAGSYFLCKNKVLKQINLPVLKNAGRNFLTENEIVNKFEILKQSEDIKYLTR